MSNVGIYVVRNTVTKQFYIGSSIDLKRRKRKHFSHLRQGKHHCSHLQRSFSDSAKNGNTGKFKRTDENYDNILYTLVRATLNSNKTVKFNLRTEFFGPFLW